MKAPSRRLVPIGSAATASWVKVVGTAGRASTSTASHAGRVAAARTRRRSMSANARHAGRSAAAEMIDATTGSSPPVSLARHTNSPTAA